MKIRAVILGCLLGSAMPTIAADRAPQVSDNGSVPTIEVGETLIKSHLNDPYSAHFVWPYEFAAGPFKWPLSRTKPGYFTCGKYNAKNAYGGFIGESWFFLQVYNGNEVILQLDTPVSYPGAESQCDELIKTSRLTARVMPVRSDPK